MGFESIRASLRGATGRKYQPGTFAACLTDAMKAGRGGGGTFRACAERAGLAEKASSAWSEADREAVSSAVRSLWA